jgi:hypothetical protein
MSFIARGGSLDVTVPAGQSIAIGSYGAGSAAIYYRSQVGNTPRMLYLQQYLSQGTVILGPYSRDQDVEVIASQASDLEYAIGVSPALSGNQTTARQVQLTGAPYTLTAADDGTYFTCSSTTTVTLPAGLSPMPQCVFAPPASGSITLHPTGGATINGSTSDVAINTVTNPVPAGLARTSITDNYGLTVAGASFASLTGVPGDNTALAAVLATLMVLPPAGEKESTAYTVLATDNEAFIWLSAQAADKIISLPAALATGVPFKCVIALINLTGAAGRCNIKGAGGAVLNTTVAQSTGALATLTTGLFMGQASVNNIAACLVCSEGSTPGGAFTVIPLCGVFATS